MHFVSYYYDKDENLSTYYKDCSNVLKTQLHSYNYNTSFDYINFSEQKLNTTYLKLNMFKPQYILQKIDQLKDAVVWLDADCYLISRLQEFENLSNYDMAVCVRPTAPPSPHAAIIYFNNTDNSKQFLKEWQTVNEIKEKDHTYQCSEHCTLIDLLKETKIPLSIKEFAGIAYPGDYKFTKRLRINSGIKIWIGVSPDAMEYERNRPQ